MRNLLVVSTLTAALCVGCAKSNPPVAANEQPQGPVIVRLVGQHQTVTVTSGPDGPLYSAQTSDGEAIVANATLDELRMTHPEVYRFVEPGVAADARWDASATPGTPRGPRDFSGPHSKPSATESAAEYRDRWQARMPAPRNRFTINHPRHFALGAS